MTNLKHLFTIGQKVKYRNEENGEMINCIVKETYEDHIVLYSNKYDMTLYCEENFNMGNVYPDYN